MAEPVPKYIKKTRDGLLLLLHVQPRASRNKIVGLHGDRLKVSVQSPPTDGKANKALQLFLSKRLGIPKSHVILKSGASSRKKTFLVKEISLGEIASKLKA